MRGLATALRKIGFSTFEQQQHVLQLLTLAGCYEEPILREDLKNAGYEENIIHQLVQLNHNLVFMDEINEDEEKKLLQWLAIAVKHAAQQHDNLSIDVYREMYNVTKNLATSLNVTTHLKYDVAIILGQTQEHLDAQSKDARQFFKEKNIIVPTIFVPNKPGNTEEVLTEYMTSVKDLYNYVNEKNVGNIYKASFFLAKTHRLLIITSEQDLVKDTKVVHNFFVRNPSWFSTEIICLSHQLTATKLLAQIHFASLQASSAKKTEATSYFLPSNFLYYGAAIGSYALNVFSHPITTGENIATVVAQPWSGLKK